MMDRIFWELHRLRAAEIADRAATRGWYLPRQRRKRTRRPLPQRDSD